MLRLTAAQIGQVARASRVLLAPLDQDSLDDWRHAANRELAALVGADSAGFLLPVAGGAPIYSAEHSAETLAPFPELAPPPLGDGTSVWTRTLAQGVATIESVYRDEAHRYYESAYYNEFALPGGARWSMSVSMAVGDESLAGAASVQLWRGPRRSRNFGDREMALLRLVEPAFRAGIAQWQRLGREGVAVMRTIDLLDQPVVAFDLDGATVHETGAVARLLRGDPDEPLVRAALAGLAARMAALGVGTDAVPAASSCEVRTTCAAYTLHACLHERAEGAARPLVLASLRREGAPRRSAEELRARYGLTRAEAAVARLVADGRRNAEIAAALGISVHTARRHTEQVLAKTGARGRAEVAAQLDR